MKRFGGGTDAEWARKRPIHPFPARMSPAIALDALRYCKAGSLIADPMMGSGTALTLAQAAGHKAVGFDLDPLAVLLSQVQTTPVDGETVRRKATVVLDNAKVVAKNILARNSYPRRADPETKKFARYWFDQTSRRQLTALAEEIHRTRNKTIRRTLWCAFSRLIITKQAGASLAMDLSHSRPHKTFDFAPRRPFDWFLSAVETVIANCPPMEAAKGAIAIAKTGDARSLPLRSRTVDLVVTSPPYLNAIDYMRCSKFSLIWMGFRIAKLRRIRSRGIGCELSLSERATPTSIKALIEHLRLRPRMANRDTAILRRYAKDMMAAVAEVFRILKPRGKAVYVVGNSTIRGTFIRNSTLIEGLAEQSGLVLTQKKVRLLPPNRRYLPPPSSFEAGDRLRTRMRQEVVLVFERPEN